MKNILKYIEFIVIAVIAIILTVLLVKSCTAPRTHYYGPDGEYEYTSGANY